MIERFDNRVGFMLYNRLVTLYNFNYVSISLAYCGQFLESSLPFPSLLQILLRLITLGVIT